MITFLSDTTMRPAWFPFGLDGSWAIAIVLKGTFRLVPDGQMVWAPAEEAAFPSGGETVDGAPWGAPIAPSDFVPIKPRAEFTLAGSACAPGGTASTGFTVAATVGERTKSAAVIGESRWTDGPDPQLTPPRPFVRQRLDWRIAAGAPGDRDNPHGMGRRPIPDGTGRTARPLPRLVPAATTTLSPTERLPPVGFGPLGGTVAGRAPLEGKFDNDFLARSWPGLPAGIDLEHFCEAPADQRFDGYLSGDERVHLKNLHPEHARLETALPQVRTRVLVRFREDLPDDHPARTAEAFPFADVRMRLDTVHLEPDADRALLVWRGLCRVGGRTLEDVTAIYAGCEALPIEPRPTVWHAEEAERIAARLGGVDIASEPADGRSPDPVLDESGSADPVGGLTNAQSAALGTDAVTDVGGTERTDGTGLDEAETAMFDGILEKVRDELNKAGFSDDLVRRVTPDIDLPAFIAALAAELPASAQARDVPDIDPLAQLRKDAIAYGIAPEEFDALVAPPQDDASTPAAPSEPRTRTRGWTRQSVIDHHAAGGSFAYADLSGLDLSAVDLSGAQLGLARLDGAELPGAILRAADLTDTSLVGADLSDADATGANLSGADLTDAAGRRLRLREAVLERSTMTRFAGEAADLSGARAAYADLSGALLTEANLDAADLSGADLTNADLQRARLREAKLVGARLGEANASAADFSGADLTRAAAGDGVRLNRAILVGITAPHATFVGADFSGADAQYADMPGAALDGAVLFGANLAAVDLRGGRLRKARLRGTCLAAADLMRVDFEAAIIVECDFRGANLFEAEFLDAIMARADFSGANVGRTKLVHPATRDQFMDNIIDDGPHATS